MIKKREIITIRKPSIKEKIEETNWLPEYHNITGMPANQTDFLPLAARRRRGFRGMYGDIDYKDREYHGKDVYI